ncbi:uncharacterized protein LOC121423524 [Lytechinus variegatus]|uniref:uncharacterized protein LOC121423524 n=1 Tax=Lytechinus variegatus TaxID=7654 RepID=UPI001BB1D7F3|nr:uncharacterized protein LOC121423524 [Lytechinus variegatus]
MNSSHFISKLKEASITPEDRLVRFDVESLFTSVPVREACDLIKKKLQEDSSLSDHTSMSPDQIHDLLLTCLESTSFQWRGNYYKQQEGAAMGSPLSPIWQHGRHSLDDFLFHLNSQHPKIAFMMEKEKNNSIPFLDFLVTREPNNQLSHQVYRKPTHTDRYLHFKSFHHPSILQSVPRTLVKRAHSISDDNHLQRELDHIKSTLVTMNGYPPHKINTKPTSSRPKEPTKATVILPYLGPTSHKLQRIFRAAKLK